MIKRTLKKAPSKPIAKIQDKEYAKIIGQAKRVKEPLIAPISGRRCVFYQILVQKKEGKNSWHTVVKEIEALVF